MEEAVLVVFAYICHDTIVFRPRAIKVDQGRFREGPNILLEVELFMVYVRRRRLDKVQPWPWWNHGRRSTGLEGFHVVTRGFRRSGEHFQL
jgi:hypothetical protein